MRLHAYTVRHFSFFFSLPLATLTSTVCPLSCFAQYKEPERNVACIFTLSNYIVYNYTVFKAGLTGLSGITNISQSVLLSHSYCFFSIKIPYVIDFSWIALLQTRTYISTAGLTQNEGRYCAGPAVHCETYFKPSFLLVLLCLGSCILWRNRQDPSRNY